MVKTAAKLGIWLVVGASSIGALLGNTNLVDLGVDVQTPWKYTVQSNIPAGTKIALIQPNGEPVTMSVPEGQAISRTFDVGAPMTLIGIYLLGSVIAFGLKSRRPHCTGP